MPDFLKTPVAFGEVRKRGPVPQASLSSLAKCDCSYYSGIIPSSKCLNKKKKENFI